MDQSTSPLISYVGVVGQLFRGIVCANLLRALLMMLVMGEDYLGHQLVDVRPVELKVREDLIWC